MAWWPEHLKWLYTQENAGRKEEETVTRGNCLKRGRERKGPERKEGSRKDEDEEIAVRSR